MCIKVVYGCVFQLRDPTFKGIKSIFLLTENLAQSLKKNPPKPYRILISRLDSVLSSRKPSLTAL